MLKLNERAWKILERLVEGSDVLRIRVHRSEKGALLIDAGVKCMGSLKAGLLISEMLLAGLGEVRLIYENGIPQIQVLTDQPLYACMASQYAGWRISMGDFFAMGSGPARVLGSKEPIIEEFEWNFREEKAVIFLETRKFPTAEVIEYIASSCKVSPENLGVVFAPTGSLVGAVQVVARVVETGIHKLHELGYDISKIVSGVGIAPLPPLGEDDLEALGRTNDAVIYGGITTYFLNDDADLSEFVKRVPSCSSSSYGLPFLEIFKRSNYNFYDIDPLLFSPAEVNLVSLITGRTFKAGRISRSLISRSFGYEAGNNKLG